MPLRELIYDLLFKGLPTAIEQSWPGWPCEGFSLAPVLSVGSAFHMAKESSADKVLATIGVVGVTVGVELLLAGALFNGAPTAMSHLWPGWPWEGFNLRLPVEGALAWMAAFVFTGLAGVEFKG